MTTSGPPVSATPPLENQKVTNQTTEPPPLFMHLFKLCDWHLSIVKMEMIGEITGGFTLINILQIISTSSNDQPYSASDWLALTGRPHTIDRWI